MRRRVRRRWGDFAWIGSFVEFYLEARFEGVGFGVRFGGCVKVDWRFLRAFCGSRERF